MSTIIGNGFGGRQPNQTAYIKQYYASSDNGIANWYFVDAPAYGISNLITPSNQGVNVLLTGDLTVQGNATFENNISVNGTTFLNDLSANNISVNNLSVKGVATFNNNISVKLYVFKLLTNQYSIPKHLFILLLLYSFL